MGNPTLDKNRNQTLSRCARFLLTLFATFAIALLVNLGLASWSTGRVTAASQGICNLIESHVAAADQIKSPKLLFIAGSNVRGGLSAQRISAALDVPAYNFGLQAALGPRLILFEARKVLHKGDTAVLAFEYNHYSEDRWNSVSSDVLLGCATDYLRLMTMPERIETLFTVDPMRVLHVQASTAVPRTQAAEFGDPDSSNLELVDAWRFGDRPLSAFTPTDAQMRLRLSLYQPMSIVFDEDARGPQAIIAFVQWAREHGVKVVATWPNTIFFPQYDGSDALKKIEDFYTRIGVPIIGTPTGAMYPVQLFYDTQYHLQPDGILKRTNDLISLLRANSWTLPQRFSREASQ